MAARKTAEKVFRSYIQGGGDSPPDDIQPLGNVIEAPPTSSGEGILHRKNMKTVASGSMLIVPAPPTSSGAGILPRKNMKTVASGSMLIVPDSGRMNDIRVQRSIRFKNDAYGKGPSNDLYTPVVFTSSLCLSVPH